jgi:hypothetical protein
VTLSLTGAARVVGGYVWLEERLFEILGAWVPSVAEPEVKLHLAADSQQHAWHASLWRDRLPALRELAAEEFVAPAAPLWEAGVAALRAAPTTIERLAGVYRVVLPRQVAAYQRHLEDASPVTDGPTIRALQLVLADEVADWRAGELLLQGVLGSAADVTRAAAQVARLETLLVAGVAGGGGRESNPPDGDRPSQPL